MRVMLRFRLFVILILCAAVRFDAAAQVVTTDPAFPTEDGPVTVFFHAAEGNAGLAGYTGDVYAHTGVITSASTGPSDWKYVKTGWGVNTPATKLERLGPDEYKLEIAGVRAYYGVPASEEIERLAFVFRSASSPYREGKAAGNADIFVDLYSGGVNVQFASPSVDPLAPILVDAGEAIPVVAVAASTTAPLAGIRLLVNDAEVAAVEDDTLRYDLVLDAPGRFDVYAVAENVAGAADTAFFYAVRNPETTEQPRPAGLEDGITYDANDPTKATLSLFAPYKDYVYVLGDFNGWEVDPAYLMQRETVNADSTYFWITLDGLEAGVEYGFQYLVDGEIRVTDPYVTKVLQEEDRFIPASTYPDLKPYPTGLARYAVGVLQTAQEPFEWTPFERPPQEELVIYELLLRDFLAAHDFDTLVDTLGYLERLGVNAIELMPVSEYDGNESWGYNPAFHFALDKYYGPPEDFKRFVDEAHRRGIAVLLDVVYNHATGASPLIRLWNEGTYGAPTAENPYANTEARHPFNVFNDLNHESPATQYWLDRANRFWLEEYNIDGYRFDLTGGFMQTGNFFGFNPSRVAILTRMAREIWEVDPEAYVVLEHLVESIQEWRVLTDFGEEEGYPGVMLWHNMNRPYNQLTMGYPTSNDFENDLSATYYETLGLSRPSTITYMESHDEQWLMFRNLAYGNRAGSYDVKDLGTALERQALAGAFFFLVPGPRMIWQFGELGYGYGNNGEQCLKPGEGNGECAATAPSRVGNKPIRWDYYDDPRRLGLYWDWRELLKLRHNNEVFTSLDTEVTLNVGEDRRTRSIMLEHPTADVLVAGNFDVVSRTETFTFPGPGTYVDAIGGTSLDVAADARVSLALAPGEYRVYASAPLSVGVEDDGAALPGTFALDQNYPNPFNPETTIRFTTPQAGSVTLEVFDLLGRRVALLVDGVRPAGEHVVRFDAHRLPSGTYLYRLQTGSRIETRAMTLVK